MNYITDEMRIQLMKIVNDEIEYETDEAGFHYSIGVRIDSHQLGILLRYLKSLDFVEQKKSLIGSPRA